MKSECPDPLASMRRMLLGLILVAVPGMILDLALLKHYESGFQITPLALLGISLAATLWLAFGSHEYRVHVFRLVMAFTILIGLIGMLLHYRGSMEFQTETYPDLSGWKLFLKVVHAKSPPALAPGAMVQLGLLGLVATYRHPALPSSASSA